MVTKNHLNCTGHEIDQTWFDTHFKISRPNEKFICAMPSSSEGSSLKEALDYCEYKSSCEGVYNENCNNPGTFKSCFKLESSNSSLANACTYIKSKIDTLIKIKYAFFKLKLI